MAAIMSRSRKSVATQRRTLLTTNMFSFAVDVIDGHDAGGHSIGWQLAVL